MPGKNKAVERQGTKRNRSKNQYRIQKLPGVLLESYNGPTSVLNRMVGQSVDPVGQVGRSLLHVDHVQWFVDPVGQVSCQRRNWNQV